MKEEQEEVDEESGPCDSVAADPPQANAAVPQGEQVKMAKTPESQPVAPELEEKEKEKEALAQEQAPVVRPQRKVSEAKAEAAVERVEVTDKRNEEPKEAPAEPVKVLEETQIGTTKKPSRQASKKGPGPTEIIPDDNKDLQISQESKKRTSIVNKETVEQQSHISKAAEIVPAEKKKQDEPAVKEAIKKEADPPPKPITGQTEPTGKKETVRQQAQVSEPAKTIPDDNKNSNISEKMKQSSTVKVETVQEPTKVQPTEIVAAEKKDKADSKETAAGQEASKRVTKKEAEPSPKPSAGHVEPTQPIADQKKKPAPEPEETKATVDSTKLLEQRTSVTQVKNVAQLTTSSSASVDKDVATKKPPAEQGKTGTFPPSLAEKAKPEKVLTVRRVVKDEIKKLTVTEGPKPMQTLGLPKLGAPKNNEPVKTLGDSKSLLKPVHKVGCRYSSLIGWLLSSLLFCFYPFSFDQRCLVTINE